MTKLGIKPETPALTPSILSAKRSIHRMFERSAVHVSKSVAQRMALSKLLIY